MDEYMRNPCPWRIVDDCGGAFSMGVIGGSLFHGIKGARNAPKGLNRRLLGSLAGIKERAPILGEWERERAPFPRLPSVHRVAGTEIR